MLSSRGPGAPLSTLSWALAIWPNQTGTAWRPFAHGRIWRELLTGEKAARDILSLSDYLAAGRSGAVEMARRFWWAAAAAVILTAGVIYAGSYLHGLPDLVRVAGSVAGWPARPACSRRDPRPCWGPG